jgi:hypothetical protein
MPAGVNYHRGIVLTPSGNVALLPYAGLPYVTIFNPITYAFSNIQTNFPGLNIQMSGGVLAPNGNVIGTTIATNGNIYVINPTNFTVSNVATNGTLAGGALLLPNGNVFLCGGGLTGNCGLYNTSCVSQTGFTNIYTGPSSFRSAVLAPNGNVIALPGGSSYLNIISYNTTNFTYSNIPVNTGYTGGCLLPSGNIICAPQFGGNIGMVDPSALTFSNIPSYVGQSAGCVLLPSGQVFFVSSAAGGNAAILSTMVPAPLEFCLSPYFNKGY